ncbi:MAG: biotin/lipoyl-containing protein [Planctomycetota bacterium]
MKREVTLPELGEDAPDAAKVSFWLVDVGEDVTQGDDLLSMTTDKATFDVPSPVSGTLLEQRGDEGDEVQVGQVIAVIETAD